MSAPGNSSAIIMAISATRQLCSATLSRRPPVVQQWRGASFNRSITRRKSINARASMALSSRVFYTKT